MVEAGAVEEVVELPVGLIKAPEVVVVVTFAEPVGTGETEAPSVVVGAVVGEGTAGVGEIPPGMAPFTQLAAAGKLPSG